MHGERNSCLQRWGKFQENWEENKVSFLSFDSIFNLTSRGLQLSFANSPMIDYLIYASALG